MKKHKEYSGSMHFFMEKRNNGHEEAKWRFRFYACLHEGKETTGLKKHIEDSGSMLVCMGGR